MPGMPSDEMIKELASLKGRAFEDRFLALMTFHHEGAIQMAHEAGLLPLIFECAFLPTRYVMRRLPKQN
jgi:hypothetical protein